MTPRHLVFHIFVCCALTASLCMGAHAGAESLPNVVLIIADDLGYADLGFLPQASADVKKHGTPAIDRLARTGVYFENAYASSPICSPSRAGLITGRFQQRWGNYWYGQGGLPQDELTIPEALKEQRYVCAKYGKTHLNGGPKEFPTLHGFDEFLGYIRGGYLRDKFHAKGAGESFSTASSVKFGAANRTSSQRRTASPASDR